MHPWDAEGSSFKREWSRPDLSNLLNKENVEKMDYTQELPNAFEVWPH